MIHTIKNDLLTISVSEQGAELQSILDANGTQYLWQGDPKYWSDRALNIFPYVARLTDGQYELDGQRYAMQIHGFAMYSWFTLTEKTDDRLVFTLKSSAETYNIYPRNLIFQVIYTLHQNILDTTYLVKNLDTKKMYFAVGGHPGFNVPLSKDKDFEDYRLRFAHSCDPRRVGFTKACFIDGTDTAYPLEGRNILPLRHEMFDEDAIVLKDMAREVTLEAADGPALTVRYPDFPYLGIWHRPHTDAPYVCIEPWSSLPSTQDKIAVLKEQKDLLQLDPGGTYTNSWQIIIHS